MCGSLSRLIIEGSRWTLAQQRVIKYSFAGVFIIRLGWIFFDRWLFNDAKSEINKGYARFVFLDSYRLDCRVYFMRKRLVVFSCEIY